MERRTAASASTTLPTGPAGQSAMTISCSSHWETWALGTNRSTWSFSQTMSERSPEPPSVRVLASMARR